jgi:hypothetical protein
MQKTRQLTLAGLAHNVEQQRINSVFTSSKENDQTGMKSN